MSRELTRSKCSSVAISAPVTRDGSASTCARACSRARVRWRLIRQRDRPQVVACERRSLMSTPQPEQMRSTRAAVTRPPPVVKVGQILSRGLRVQRGSRCSGSRGCAFAENVGPVIALCGRQSLLDERPAHNESHDSRSDESVPSSHPGARRRLRPQAVPPRDASDAKHPASFGDTPSIEACWGQGSVLILDCCSSRLPFIRDSTTFTPSLIPVSGPSTLALEDPAYSARNGLMFVHEGGTTEIESGGCDGFDGR